MPFPTTCPPDFHYSTSSSPTYLTSLDRSSTTQEILIGTGATALTLGLFPHLVSQEFYRSVSSTGIFLYLGAGVGLPIVEDGKEGMQHSLRAVDALIITGAFTEGLKFVTQERRPTTSSRDSFPSGHASSAFCIATIQSAYHPRQAALWFGGATLIAASRLSLRRHYVQDVLVGAGLGYLTARWELSRTKGLLLTPWIHQDGIGLALKSEF